MDNPRNTAFLARLVCLVGSLALCVSAAQPAEAAQGTAYDALPDGAPSQVAQLFYSALDVPQVAEWLPRDRRDLLDVVTLRYKNRLIDRAPAASLERAKRYVERLAQSALAQEFPNVVRQTCAQYGLTTGSCGKHRNYVRRALVMEEMLVQRQLTLDQLETELAGATRLKLAAWQASRSE